jgi:hypothetical protein
MASQASPASSNDLIRKEVFLPRPPLPFDCDREGDERSRNHDIDEDWLPELKDIITGNCHVMIDMTSGLDSEVCQHLHTTKIVRYKALILVARRMTPNLPVDTHDLIQGPSPQQPLLPDLNRPPMAKDLPGRASHRRLRIASIPSGLRSQNHPARLRCVQP